MGLMPVWFVSLFLSLSQTNKQKHLSHSLNYYSEHYCAGFAPSSLYTPFYLTKLNNKVKMQLSITQFAAVAAFFGMATAAPAE